jgi:hypothetical protein
MTHDVKILSPSLGRWEGREATRPEFSFQLQASFEASHISKPFKYPSAGCAY